MRARLGCNLRPDACQGLALARRRRLAFNFPRRARADLRRENRRPALLCTVLLLCFFSFLLCRARRAVSSGNSAPYTVCVCICARVAIFGAQKRSHFCCEAQMRLLALAAPPKGCT